MKVSLIIAVYKDTQALDLIIKSLYTQTYKNFEVVICEDGESKQMKEYINNIKDLDITHTTQEDIGVRKSQSQNNGIRNSSGEYLIFIDGDCVLFHNFIENHIKLSSEKIIVSGRRVNLGPKYSSLLRDHKISPLNLENSFFKKYLDISNDAKKEKHSEEGFLIKPNGIIHNIIKFFKKSEPSLLGCNFSCYKKAMLDINGFDEELGNAAVAGDTDLEWRFKALDYKFISGKFITNQFHLYHERKAEDYNRGMDEKMQENKKANRFRCEQGIY